MEKRLWYFYFEDEYGNKHYKTYIQAHTKNLSEQSIILEQMLNAGVIERYGFEVSEEHTLAYKVNQI